MKREYIEAARVLAASLPDSLWFNSDATPPPFNYEQAQHISELTDDNPSDEPCVFCDPPLKDHEIMPFDFAMPIVSGQIAVKATLGMMRPAYLLGITKQHVTSFAQLSEEVLAQTGQAFSMIEQRILHRLVLTQFGSRYTSYLRLEHGSDDIDSCGLGAGACVAHAHQHLIPATDKTAENMLGDSAISWQALDCYEDLTQARGRPYMYVGHEGSHYVAINPGVVSQWGRRIIAKEDGHEDWDWAMRHGAVTFVQSMLVLGMQLPPGVTHVNTADTAVRYLDEPLRGKSLLPTEEFDAKEIDQNAPTSEDSKLRPECKQ